MSYSLTSEAKDHMEDVPKPYTPLAADPTRACWDIINLHARLAAENRQSSFKYMHPTLSYCETHKRVVVTPRSSWASVFRGTNESWMQGGPQVYCGLCVANSPVSAEQQVGAMYGRGSLETLRVNWEKAFLRCTQHASSSKVNVYLDLQSIEDTRWYDYVLGAFGLAEQVRANIKSSNLDGFPDYENSLGQFARDAEERTTVLCRAYVLDTLTFFKPGCKAYCPVHYEIADLVPYQMLKFYNKECGYCYDESMDCTSNYKPDIEYNILSEATYNPAVLQPRTNGRRRDYSSDLDKDSSSTSISSSSMSF